MIDLIKWLFRATPLTTPKQEAVDVGIVDVCLHMAYGQIHKVRFKGKRINSTTVTADELAKAYIFKSGQQGFFLVGDKYHNASDVRNITLEGKSCRE